MAKSVFDANPGVNELMCFPDGTCFLPHKTGEIALHAKNTKTEAKLTKREVKPAKEK